MAKQQEEKHEAKMKLLNDRVHHDLPLTEAAPPPRPLGGGEKKRRKRRLPRRVRIRRCGQGFRSRSSLSGACTMLFTQCSLWSSAGLRCSTSWPVRIRRTVARSSCARLVLLVILHLALCFFPCRQAQEVRHRGRYGSEGLLPAGAVLVVCNDRCRWVDRVETAVFPQLQLIFKVVYLPVEVQRSFPMVQTVLRTLQILQLQFVARWSMSSSCWCGRYHRCFSWTRVWTCPLCTTSAAGRDCAGLRSCSSSASWSDVYGGLWTEVDSLLAVENLDFHEPLVSASHCVNKRQRRRLSEEFLFLSVEVDTDPARFAQGNLDIIPTSFLKASQGGILQHFAVFFALRPAGRKCPFFSPR